MFREASANCRMEEFSGIWLDFAIRGCYTRSVRNPQREFRVFWSACTESAGFWTEKLNQGRMKDTERDRVDRGAEGECKNSQAKGSDPDDTSESAGLPAHQRGNRKPFQAEGNLSGKDGGKKTKCLFVSFSLSR